MRAIAEIWPIALAVATHVGATLWIAFIDAAQDAKDIKKHVRIEHVERWLRRAAWVACSAGACAWASWKNGMPRYSVLPLLVLGAFLFSAVFRYRLNKLRGLHLCYVGPSNAYDRFWIYAVALAWTIADGYISKYLLQDIKAVLRGHSAWMVGTGPQTIGYTARDGVKRLVDFTCENYRRSLYRSGLLCYITEITLSVLSLGVIGAITMKGIQ